MTKRSVTKKPKLTQWFDGSVKPVRDGVYQRSPANSEYGLYWLFKDGAWRYGGDGHPRHVRLGARAKSPQQDLPWRGLAVKP
jgi:hypothetical protein